MNNKGPHLEILRVGGTYACWNAAGVLLARGEVSELDGNFVTFSDGHEVPLRIIKTVRKEA